MVEAMLNSYCVMCKSFVSPASFAVPTLVRSKKESVKSTLKQGNGMSKYDHLQLALTELTSSREPTSCPTSTTTPSPSLQTLQDSYFESAP